MKNLYFIEYGCSCCSETLIVSCNDSNAALQRDGLCASGSY